MSAAVLSAIRDAWPDTRAKHIVAALGCSAITGKLIGSTGNVSGRYRLPLIRVLDETIALKAIRRANLSGGNSGGIEVPRK